MLLAKRLVVHVYPSQVKRNYEYKFCKFGFDSLTSRHFSLMYSVTLLWEVPSVYKFLWARKLLKKEEMGFKSRFICQDEQTSYKIEFRN